MSQISRFITGANALDIVADSGTGSPQNDTLEVLGGTNVTTSISGNTVTINSSGGVTSPTFEGDGGGTASPSGGVLQMDGGLNITSSASTDTVTYALDQTLTSINNIELAETDATGSVGVISMQNSSSGVQERLIHAGDNGVSGLSNFFAGALAGSFSVSGQDNTGIGRQSLQNIDGSRQTVAVGARSAVNLTEGGGQNVVIGYNALSAAYNGSNPRNSNVAVGTDALRDLEEWQSNTAIGDRAFVNLVNGFNNIGLGRNVGINFTGSESSNLLVGSPGVAGDGGTIRIGNSTDHFSTFIEGIQGVTPSGTNEVMLIDNNNQLGSEAQLGLARGGTGIDASGVTDGQLLIGGSASNDLQLSTLTGGNNLTVTNGTNSITLDVDGTVADTFSADSGTATPSSGSLTIAGGTNVTTSASGSTVTIDASGGGGTALTWQTQSTNITMSVNNGYIPSGSTGVLTLILPATAAVGERVAIAGYDADGWSIAQNSGQTIHFGDQDTTTGTSGSLSSNQRYDSIELICVVTDTEWVVRSSIGNITVT